jgi:hypothetical protein
MAEEKNYIEHQPQNVFQRLLCNQKKELENNVQNFQPVINSVSQEIDYNINMGSNQPRWERLYSLQDERRQQTEQINREKELEQLQTDQECTFKPQLISNKSERLVTGTYG